MNNQISRIKYQRPNKEGEVAIMVDSVSKSFKLPHEKQSSIKGLFLNVFSGKKTYEKQKVLRDINFEIKKGEFFGIVGRNGSGKSTLLKLMAGIYSPNSGAVQINGKLTPFIELGVGFNPELTGRENVFLNGALLGFSRKEMEKLYSEIVEFAELEKFMDQKLKNYSSGMQVRLAFSIAMQAKSDILVLDEVLAVGDKAFQEKCIDIFESYKAKKQTIILVTHDMETVRRFCNRAMLLDDGKILEQGEPNKIASRYSAINRQKEKLGEQSAVKQQTNIQTIIKNTKGVQTNVHKINDRVTIRITWSKSSKKVRNVGLAIIKNSGEYMFGSNTIGRNINLKTNAIDYNLQLSIGPGKYYVMMGLFGETKYDVIDFLNQGEEFTIEEKPDDSSQGLVRLDHEWTEVV